MQNNIPNHAQRKIMLSFAFLAYSGEQITTGNPESAILGLINKAMPKIPPIATGSPAAAAWKVVWGPAVYTVPGSLYQDHMMFAVQSVADPNQIAIAIRGTNAKAEIDWLLDDFSIMDMMPWPPNASGSSVAGHISESTSVDLQRLLLMTSPLQNDTTLLQFLQSTVTSLPGPPNICVTGHSKGGTMSSTMALYLKDTQSTWDSNGTAIVSNISFAGPTAGDRDFANYSDKQFANPASYPAGWDSSLGSTCDACRNSLDVAPLAWNYDNFNKIVTLYSPNIKMGWGWSLIKGAVQSGLKKLVQAQDFTQVKASQATLQGKFSGKRTGHFTGLEKSVMLYAAEAAIQHHAYPDLLGVPELDDPTIVVVK